MVSLQQVYTALIVGAAGKLFIMLADTMPPPPEDCGYLRRWFHDFVQRAASNSNKVGESRPADKPIDTTSHVLAPAEEQTKDATQSWRPAATPIQGNR